MVTIDLDGEKIAGFVREEFVQRGAVRGTVIDIGKDWITVKLPGSFFTRAAGRTRVPADWASEHLQPASA